MPEDVISGFEEVDGKYKVTNKTPGTLLPRPRLLPGADRTRRCRLRTDHEVRSSLPRSEQKADVWRRFASNPQTRKRAFINYESRLTSNIPILSKIFSLRRQAAHVLGYKTWADFSLEPKMAKTREWVDEFLGDLEGKLKGIGERERERLLGLKREEVEKLRLEGADPDKLYIWDYRCARLPPPPRRICSC